MEEQPEKKLCPRCKQRLITKKKSYCAPCSTEYERQRRKDLADGKPPRRWRSCERCGIHFEGAGANALCRECRLAYRERECSKCAEMFWYQGPHKICVKCRRTARAAYMKTWQRSRRNEDRDKKFALVPGEWDKRLVDQDYKCLLCSTLLAADGRTSAGPCMDHDHRCCAWNPTVQQPVCGKCNRGIICKRCNSMLGLALDSAELLRLGAVYLERYSMASR